jgi:hypothetical protein
MQRPAVSLSSDSEMSVGIKINREVHMKAGKNTKTEKLALKLKTRLTLKFRIIVAAVVGCLMAAPLTRAYKHKSANKALEMDWAKPCRFLKGSI